jgi:hypothetical protein
VGVAPVAGAAPQLPRPTPLGLCGIIEGLGLNLREYKWGGGDIRGGKGIDHTGALLYRRGAWTAPETIHEGRG